MTDFENAFESKDLTLHKDERGFLVELLRSDEEMYKKFGQVYSKRSTTTGCKIRPRPTMTL